MKRSKLEEVILVAGSSFILLEVFHKPIGLRDDWEWPFLIATGACWVMFFVLRRRQKSSSSTSEETASPPNLVRQRNVRLLSLILMIAVSLSGPWWLPYTGIGLPFPQMVVSPSLPASLALPFISSRPDAGHERPNHSDAANGYPLRAELFQMINTLPLRFVLAPGSRR
jgi:hypothetical protein